MRPLTEDEQKHLYELVANPPPGSKIEAAKRLGIDFSINLRLLGLTAEQRLEEAESHWRFQEQMEQALLRETTQQRLQVEYLWSSRPRLRW
jgi:hypothetical protein